MATRDALFKRRAPRELPDRKKPTAEFEKYSSETADERDSSSPSNDKDESFVTPKHGHVDYPFFGAETTRDNKLNDFPGEKFEKFKQCRWVIIHLWRPFNIVTGDKLALYDARTTDADDFAAVQTILSESLAKAKMVTNSQREHAQRLGRSEPNLVRTSGVMLQR
ncbi:hypothetical protein FKW77_007665 [Venturia effusa]|uniref:Uncharacterized protein n=1 Tax=Venturia effusa TaxID=50376 RepID=A0A517L7N8_9PEZI|nr:hypothetical protein FKW77_007665 [Venturia effusa]